MRLQNNVIQPASKYSYTDDLWVISCFFNSNSYHTKTNNFEKFIEKIETSKLNYLIVECAFGDQPFSLPKNKHILQPYNGKPRKKWSKRKKLKIKFASNYICTERHFLHQ